MCFDLQPFVLLFRAEEVPSVLVLPVGDGAPIGAGDDWKATPSSPISLEVIKFSSVYTRRGLRLFAFVSCAACDVSMTCVGMVGQRLE